MNIRYSHYPLKKVRVSTLHCAKVVRMNKLFSVYIFIVSVNRVGSELFINKKINSLHFFHSATYSI